MPANAKILTDQYAAQTIVATSDASSARWRKLCSRKGAVVLPVRAQQGKVSLKTLLKECAKREMMHVLCEGGGGLASALMQQKLVDELILFYAPKVMGDAACRRAFPAGPDRLAAAWNLKIIEQKQVGADLMVRARPEWR